MRTNISTPLETTGGISFSMKGFKNPYLQFVTNYAEVYNSTGGIQISLQGVYNSTGGIQISLQRVKNSTGGIQISIKVVYNTTGVIQINI